jgi:hypothetical protein
MVQVGRTRRFGDRDLARVNQVGIDVGAAGQTAHAEQAVLGVEHNTGLGRQVIGDDGGLADAEVDVRSRGYVAGDDGGEFSAIERSSVEVFDTILADGRGQRFISRMRST